MLKIRDLPSATVAWDAAPFYSQYPYLGQIISLGSVDDSNYDGLQTTLTARNFHNLSMVADTRIATLSI